jgi:hypothetical protein
MLGIYFFFAIPLLILFAVAEPGQSGALALLAAAIAGLGALLWLFARRRGNARAGYRDPQIHVEIGPDAIGLSAPGRIETLSYAEAEIAFTCVTLRNTTSFLGLVLQSPLGPLRLDNLWFKPGQEAAAALAGRLEAAGRLPRVGE